MKPRFLKGYKPGGLILTPLLDMFTIILIFLIVSFDAEDQNFDLNDQLELPDSSARSIFKPAVNLAITPTSLIVEKKELTTLRQGRFSAQMYEGGEIPELVEKLRIYHARIVETSPDQETADERAIVLIQADKNLDYDTLYLVLRSASVAGFVKYRLAVMKK